MDTKANLAYLASSSRIGIRAWHRRSDRGKIERWPPYAPALPAHWLAAPPVTRGERVSYAVDLLAAPPADRLVGRISLVCYDTGSARIGIVLHPQHLGVGVGTEAMQLATHAARQLGVTVLRLDVASENVRAIRCYERAGYVSIGDEWRGPYRYIVMARSVEGQSHASR